VQKADVTTAGFHEPGFTPQELADPALAEIRDLLYRASGTYQSENRFDFLAKRCRRRMKCLDSTSFADYLERLASPAGPDDEIRLLLNELLIGETSFFRNPPQLDAMVKIILPKLLAAKVSADCRRLRIWSAGCSTGEEPYTLAIVFLEKVARAWPQWTLEILATDLNDEALQKCRAGIYDEYALRNAGAEIRARYFRAADAAFAVVEQARELVSFSRLNLNDPAAMAEMHSFDLIFCCNVLIYFEEASKHRAINNFYRALHPGGYFFVSDCESLYHTQHDFRLLHYPAAIAYRKAIPGEFPGDAI
jgi:chemotaxis protein methyltransferase CheR